MSAGPLIHGGESVRRMMLLALLATGIPSIAAVWRHGASGAGLMLAAVGASWAVESIWLRKPAFDGSALLTGAIIGLVLPASAPIWLGALAGALGASAGKLIWGGLGKNLFNPAAVSRVLLMILVPLQLFAPQWPIDGISAATPLAKEIGATAPVLAALLRGEHGGTLAEAAPLAVLAGGGLLLVLRVADWRIPVTYLSVVAILAVVLPAGDRMIGHAPWLADAPIAHLTCGGVLLAAFFMLTDPVTAPFTPGGRIVFAALAATFTMLVRFYTQFPDGVILAVLLANAATPWIDSATLRWAAARRNSG